MRNDEGTVASIQPTMEAYDHRGVLVDDVGSVDNEEIDGIDMKMRAVEVAVACCIRDAKQLVDALGAMVRAPTPGSRQAMHHTQLTSDHADSTVLLLRTVARDALSDCMNVVEPDMRLQAARAMLQSFHAGLMSVNIHVDSTPGIALAKLFIPCCHVVLSAKASPAAKRDALDRWRSGRRDILAKSARAG